MTVSTYTKPGIFGSGCYTCPISFDCKADYNSIACLELRRDRNLKVPFTRGDAFRQMKDRDISNFMSKIGACNQGSEIAKACQQGADGLCYECWMQYLTRDHDTAKADR